MSECDTMLDAAFTRAIFFSSVVFGEAARRPVLVAGRTGRRPHWSQAALVAGRTGRRPHWAQAALGAGRTGCRPHWVQAALGAGRTGCRPHWVQAVLGALHQHWVEWRGRVTREVFLRPTGRCSGQCQPERGRRVSPTGRSLSQRDGVCPNGTEFVPTGRSLSQRDGVCPNGTVCSGLVWSGQVWSNGSLAVYV